MGAEDLLSLSFPLDDRTMREAEEAAARFVGGPWCNGIPEALAPVSPNGASNAVTLDGAYAEVMPVVAMPEVVEVKGSKALQPHAPPFVPAAEAAGVPAVPVAATAPATAVAAPTTPASTASPQRERWSAMSEATSPHDGPRDPWSDASEVPAPLPAPVPAPVPAPAPAAAPQQRERWASMSEDQNDSTSDASPQATAEVQRFAAGMPAGPRRVRCPPAEQGPPQSLAERPGSRGGSSEEAVERAVAEPSPSSAAVAEASSGASESPGRLSAAALPVDARRAGSSSGPASEGRPAEAAENDGGARPSSPAAPAGNGGSGAAQSSSAAPGRPYSQPRTWANIVNKDGKTEVISSRMGPTASSSSSGRGGDEHRTRKDSIIDYILWLARVKGDVAEGKANGHPPELPDELRKFKPILESGVTNFSKAKYSRRGMKNDANNCYVNVVVQSLLPCSSLMQLLSHCSPTDVERPFYTGMTRLCKEFHNAKIIDACNVLNMPQVKDIISTWQSIGAQQDAGEFLFYMLNGMHEECKWKVLPTEPSSSNAESRGTDGEDWSQVGNGASRKVEVRSAGVHEDSPIVRIFGGLLRSSVRSKNAKADSVSLEPFNHLILDISSPAVDSVWTALEAYCGAEAVNEGRATKRLRFEMLPKVLIVNLKRFSYNKDAECPQKIKKAVKYEEKLVFDRSWLIDDLEPPAYQLAAVICHHGESANGGHYNAIVRYNSDWYMYDDALVRQLELREVMNQQFTAYLLLYLSQNRVDICP
mmetsp:Transcript_8795/g.19331  ORF Transcript_8795/g.19331 Transcript_8795/m.19331 type:complete len:761 (+) Transcript_8795:124-2406(+)